MFDCLCPLPNRWAAKPHAPVVPRKDVPHETIPNQRLPVTGDRWMFAAEFLQHLHVFWVQYGPYLRWYAVLISTIESVLLVSMLLSQSSWLHRLQWRPLYHIPQYLRINFALVISVLTFYSNLSAIAGVLMVDRWFLWPYMLLHLFPFLAELTYVLLDLLSSSMVWKVDPTVINDKPKHWKLLPLFWSFNLSIMIAVYLQLGPPSG